MESVAMESWEWNGNLTFAAALDAAMGGQWNAPKIENLTLPAITGESEEVTFSYDVVGQHLDVSAFVAGEPEYWQVENPVSKPCGKIFRFAVEIGGPQFVEASQMANRGQAIIALVHSLELQGHSVEVTIVRAYQTSASEHYNFLIPIKHAGQALDTKRLQFMIGHPAFYRRCLFGFAEVAHGESMATCSTHTRTYSPVGFTHIPHYSGLASSLEQSMQWAEGFAHGINTQN
jgi:hypothetical protein